MTSPGTRLRALGALVDVTVMKLNLMIKLGLIPSSLVDYRHPEKALEIMTKFMDVLIRQDPPLEVIEELQQILESGRSVAAEARELVPPPPPRWSSAQF